jgi:hypothetical protein
MQITSNSILIIYTIVGNLTGGSGSSSHGIFCGTIVNVTITGTVTGGSISNSSGFSFTTNATIVLNGSIVGVGIGAQLSGGSTVTINGNITGGSLGVGLNISGSSNVVITGWVRAGTGNNHGVNIAGGSGTLTADAAIGSSFAGGLAVGIANNSSSAAASVRDMEWGTGGQTPVYGWVHFKNVANIKTKVQKILLLGLTELIDASAGAGSSPDPEDVRDGVVYDFGGQTGTLAVPLPIYVAAGVPTDDTVGSMAGGGGGSDYANLVIINNGVKKASLGVPHTDDLIP